MLIEVLNKKLIKSNNKSKTKRVLEIIRNETPKSHATKLSQVLNFLPAGFVYKEETGIGATTLELTSKRNSIIVEPIKITASSKAHEHAALYVGSPTRYHTQKSSKKVDIIKYVKDKAIPYKKIVVVADSLPRVVEAIGADVFKDYFLLIDEIDSFQLDSSYRKSMEACIEIYSKFKPENRAMLSATKINFTDPSLKQEPVVEIKYDIKKPRKISVYTTNAFEILGVVVDSITNIIKKYPGDKIFIAYNSVNGCLNLAQHLVDNNIISRNEIKILCSSASKKSAKDYYNELDNDVLPSTVNFFTSAYFTGFDLNEQYHLVTVSGNRNKVHALSDRRMKQIAGRSRKGLLSETIIHDIAIGNLKDDFSEQEFIAAAKEQVESHNCMKRHYSKNPLLKMFINDINEQFLKVLEANELKLIRKDEKGDFKISYLNIDAALESIRVRKQLYLNSAALSNELIKSGEIVKHKILHSNTVVQDKKVSIQERDAQVEEIIERLRTVNSSFEIEEEISSGAYFGIQEKIAEDFCKIIGFLETDSTLDLLKDNIIGKRDLREYNRIIKSALFHIAPKTQLTVSRFDIQFPIKGKYTADEILSRVNLALSESQIPKVIKTTASAIRLLKTFYLTYRKRDMKTKTDYIGVKSKNPYGFNIMKTKKSMDENTMFAVIMSYS